MVEHLPSKHEALGSIPTTIIIKMIVTKPGMVVHACNPDTWEAETGGSGFVASLSYLVRPPQFSETLFQNKE